MNLLRSAMLDAWRLLRARPLGNLAAVLVLACGLMVVTTMASLMDSINGVMPTTIPTAGLYIYGAGPGSASSLMVTGSEGLALRRDISGLADSALLRWNDFNVASGNAADGVRAERVSGMLVDGDPFGLLGWPMTLGRGFTDSDFAADAAASVVIGDRLWRARFAADPSIVGRLIRVDGSPATVVGVLPPQRAYPFQQQLYRAVNLAALPEQQTRPWQSLVHIDDPARLQAAAAALAAQQSDREQRLGETAKSQPLRISALFDNTGSDDPSTQMLALVLAVVAGLVMLLAASNAGGLLLVQWLGRDRELATRNALGATSERIVASLLLHGLLLAALAWLLALLASVQVLAALNHYLWSSENGQPLYYALAISPSVLAISAGTALSAVVVLIVPTWRRLRRGDLALDLRSGGRTAGGIRSRFGRVMFGLQTLLAVVTVLTTLQAVEGARTQLARPLGLDTERVLVAQFSGSDNAAKAQFAQRLRERLAAEPEVAAVTVSGNLPIALTSRRDIANGEARTQADFAPVDLGYRDVYGFGLRSGRWFTSEEIEQHDAVAVIDPAFAAALFGDDDAVGRRFSLRDSGKDIEHLIVGVSEPVRLGGNGGPDQPSVFVPLPGQPVYELGISVRSRGDAERFAPRLLAIANEIDPDFALTDVGSFADLRWRANAWTRLVLSLFTPLGVLALVLAAAGLAALLGSLVTQRVREIGVRRALGASTRNVVRVLIGGLSLWAGVGALLGIGLGLLLVGPLSQSLYGDSSLGAFSIVGTLAVMAAALLGAAAAPIRRALRIAPTEALREE
ncbi:MAG: ABC transporter permease [Xanthomonadales bacterium]|nr:ABC transporter permease [Xanthomonadales bacterium]MDZ4116514.1 ABC transporter permease [Xanthomonadaceae bacterium]MDZ4378734.1 ABC transporter permease [Xanthomonadaceae bacterium]